MKKSMLSLVAAIIIATSVCAIADSGKQAVTDEINKFIENAYLRRTYDKLFDMGASYAGGTFFRDMVLVTMQTSQNRGVFIEDEDSLWFSSQFYLIFDGIADKYPEISVAMYVNDGEDTIYVVTEEGVFDYGAKIMHPHNE